jgi:alkanesulfonate monooxygenase SsuD/methylene tetrahydromethanopterin reductase-like flavin-dependent oxidoreductase (luciferase family)
LAEEFTALGVDKSKRGKITDEMLEFLRSAFENDQVTENGQALVLKPRPARPPFLIGGSSAVAIPRAIRSGDGWIPVGILPADLKPLVDDFNRQAADAGRTPMETVIMKTLPFDDSKQAVEMARDYRDAGVTHLVHTQNYDTPAEYRKMVANMTNLIQPQVA